MSISKERIFIKLLFPFAAGILCGYITGIQISSWILIALIPLLPALHFLINRKILTAYTQGWLFGVAAFTLFFFSGWFSFSTTYDLNDENHFINFGKDEFAIVRLTEPPVFKEKFARCIVEVSQTGSQKFIRSVSGNAVVYFSLNDTSRNFHYGDEILIANNPSPLDSVSNPYQYDYRGYLDKKNIHFTFFEKQNQFVPLNINQGFSLLRFAYQMRDWCVGIIKKYVGETKESAVIAALVVGYRDEVSPEIVQSFSSAGVVHILAVSGMHVGILYWLLDKILVFLRMNKKKSLQLIKVFILMGFIWFFAMITGLSGSVVRASAMLTLLIIGKNYGRHTDIINLLCASAFCILAFDVFSFLDAGFQLSFFALVGIALFERNIYWTFKLRNKFLHLCWSMCSVSIAAQLGVLPLTLFYFNQFPLMFLVANIIGVPLSTGILFGGVGLFAISGVANFYSPISNIAWWYGKALGFATWLLDQFINWVQHLPYASLNMGHFNIACFILAFFGLYFLYEFLEWKIQRKLIYALSVALIISFIYNYSNIKEMNRREIMFLHFGKGNLYVFRERNNSLMLGDSSLLSDGYFLQYTNSYLKKTCVNHLQILPLEKINDTSSVNWNHFHSRGKFISFDGLHGAVLDQSDISSDKKLKLDFVIADAASNKPDLIKENYSPKVWVADADVKSLALEEVKGICASLSLQFHFLPVDGAYIKQF